MNSSTYLIILFFVLIVVLQRRRRMMIFQQQILFPNPKERLQMIELAKQFLSKECIVFYFDSHVKGTILEVDDGAILLATKYGKEIINLNFVTRICECSKKKK